MAGHGPVPHHGRSRWHTHNASKNLSGPVYITRHLSQLFMPAEPEVRVPVRGVSLSLCRPFLCNATIAQCPRALQSRSSGSDRQTYPRLFLSPFPEVFSLPDFRDRDRQRREREHASEDETGICPRDACGIDRADRMDQGWKRVFEFEMEGYVLSFLLSVEFTLRSIAAKLISDRSSLGKENFFFVETKSNR